MDKGKKQILLIISLVLILIVFIALYINHQNTNHINKGDNNSSSDSPSNGNNSNNNSSSEPISLENDNLFFQIQDVLNNYYYLLSIQDKQSIYNLLDDTYIKENNITLDNLTNVIPTSYESVSYIAKEIYYCSFNNLKYYFVNGYMIDNSVDGSRMNYEANVNYLVIIKNNEYVIKPLNNIDNLFTYAHNYQLEDKSIQSNFKLRNITVTTDKKLTTYIYEFTNLLFADPKRAYSMLDSKMLTKYPSYEVFYNDIESIYERIDKRVFGYNEQIDKDNKIYTIEGPSSKRIIITEKKVMDYQINFS